MNTGPSAAARFALETSLMKSRLVMVCTGLGALFCEIVGLTYRVARFAMFSV